MKKLSLVGTGLVALILISGLGGARNAHAAAITLGTASAAWTAAMTAGGNVNADQQLADSFNNGILSATSRANVSDAFARASSSGQAGLLFDRADNPERFIIGASVVGSLYTPGGLSGISTISNQFSNVNLSPTGSLPNVGADAQATVLLGFKPSWAHIDHIGPLKGDKLFLTLSLGTYSMTTSNLSFRMFNVGAGASYKIIDPVGPGWFLKWGGVSLNSGLHYSSSSTGFSQTLASGQGGSLGSPNLSMPFNATVSNSNFLIPLEASTNVQLLYALTFYAGGAFDINIGSSSLGGVSTGTMSANGVSSVSRDVSVDLGADSVSRAHVWGQLRGFFGTQVNLWAIKVGADINAMANGTFATTVGARVAL